MEWTALPARLPPRRRRGDPAPPPEPKGVCRPLRFCAKEPFKNFRSAQAPSHAGCVSDRIVGRRRWRRGGVNIQFDPAFVEEAVFLELKRAASLGQGQTQRMFRQEWTALYEENSSPEEREAAFQRLSDRYFKALGLSELFAQRFEEFPELATVIEVALVRGVFSRKEERVEFYVSRARDGEPGIRVPTVLFIGLQAARCLDRDPLVAFLRHELMHVCDMINPAFKYDPRADLGGACKAEEELIRERFRLLWNMWVHGRCKRKGWQTLKEDLIRLQEQEIFQIVGGRDRWTQQELLALAHG